MSWNSFRFSFRLKSSLGLKVEYLNRRVKSVAEVKTLFAAESGKTFQCCSKRKWGHRLSYRWGIGDTQFSHVATGKVVRFGQTNQRKPRKRSSQLRSKEPSLRQNAIPTMAVPDQVLSLVSSSAFGSIRMTPCSARSFKYT